jgi:predicted transcriptional regulator
MGSTASLPTSSRPAGKATVAECEEELKMNRRTLQRDLKLLVEKGLVREVGTGPTDPTKYYQPLL